MLTSISGLDQFDRALGELTVELEKKFVREALREAAQVTRGRVLIKLAPHSRTGALLKSVRITTRIDKRRGRARALLRIGGQYRGLDVWYAHFLEGGTKPHEIRPKGAKSLFFAGLARKQIKHPGVRARHHVRNAFEETSAAALLVLRSHLATDINRHARAAHAKSVAANRARVG